MTREESYISILRLFLKDFNKEVIYYDLFYGADVFSWVALDANQKSLSSESLITNVQKIYHKLFVSNLKQIEISKLKNELTALTEAEFQKYPHIKRHWVFN